MSHQVYLSENTTSTLLIEVDGTAKLGIRRDLELFHLLFTLLCRGGQGGELGRDIGLILFKSFYGSMLR